MKRILFIAGLAVAVILAGCSKTADEVMPSQQKSVLMAKTNNLVPISGEVTGMANPANAQFPFDHKRIQAQGNVSHLGNCTIDFHYFYLHVNPLPTAIFNGIVSITSYGKIIAANGDELNFQVIQKDIYQSGGASIPYGGTYKFGDWVSTSLPAPYNYLPTTNSSDHILLSITGGTGRFEDATGNIEAWAYQWDVDALSSVATPTTVWFQGEINY